MEWKPSQKEMKKADMMDPGNEPEGIMEVILSTLSLLANAALTLFTVSPRWTAAYVVDAHAMPELCSSLPDSLEAEP